MIKFKSITLFVKMCTVTALLSSSASYSLGFSQTYTQAYLQAYAQASSKDSKQAPAQNIPQNSIYQLNNTWLDQDGHERLLSSFSGKKQIVSLIYTHCAHTCPTIVSTMQAIENKLSDEEKNNVGFILVSLTPDTDTPTVLQSFAQSRKLSAHNWSLLTGSADDVRSLAAALNIKYQNIGNSEVEHSNIMTVLDQQGRIKFQKTGVISNATFTAKELANF
ncbi:MAG: SCO family protein [Pseudoalteromonas nigrifaciens]|uniref:SCO family protein n=1 Tax=Pseudoalteromonas nigrifaciens TaxID=28109 RepID=UPI003C706F4F